MNKELKKTISEFLAHGVKCAVSDMNQLSKIGKDSFAMTDGVIFNTDKKYRELREKSLALIAKSKSFKKTHITESEIGSLLFKKVAQQYKIGEDQTDTVIEEIEKLKNSKIQYVVPNRAILLQDGLSNLKIGPVEIV